MNKAEEFLIRAAVDFVERPDKRFNFAAWELFTYIRDNANRPIPEGEHIIVRNPYVAAIYASIAFKERWHRAEPVIKTNPRACAFYAERVLKGRWHEMEDFIAADPIAACEYAQGVLRAPWPEAEEVIASDGEAAADYAMWVLKGRWPEAESAIATSGRAGEYASKYRRQRWPEAEPVIMKHARSAAHYAVDVLGRRWPEAEPAIAKSGYDAFFYIHWLIKAEWPEAEDALLETIVGTAPRYAVEHRKRRWPELELKMLRERNAQAVSHYAKYTHPFNDYEQRNFDEYAAAFLGGKWPEAQLALEGKWIDTSPFPLPQAPSAADSYGEDDDAPAAAPATTEPGKGEPSLQAVFKELDNLIGLDGVKAELRRIAAYAAMVRGRREAGLRSPQTALHMVFTGNPGTGKTTVARLVGQIYKALGVLETGHVIEADRADLVAEYLGQTDAKTKAKIEEANGGVLFIDEAYTLAPPHTQRDYGQEAINALLTEMENKRERMAVIAAGYPDEMERFLESNPGLRSRFSRKIMFADYDGPDMLAIFGKMAEDHDYRIEDDAREELAGLFDETYAARGPQFSNGRFVRNVFEKVIEAMSLRYAEDPKMDLATIQRIDIPISISLDG